MQIGNFLATLPTLYRDWGTVAMQPQTHGFDVVLSQLSKDFEFLFIVMIGQIRYLGINNLEQLGEFEVEDLRDKVKP